MATLGDAAAGCSRWTLLQGHQGESQQPGNFGRVREKVPVWVKSMPVCLCVLSTHSNIPVDIAQRLCLIPAAGTYNSLSPRNLSSDDEHLPEQTITELTPKAFQPLIFHL